LNISIEPKPLYDGRHTDRVIDRRETAVLDDPIDQLLAAAVDLACRQPERVPGDRHPGDPAGETARALEVGGHEHRLDVLAE
jgi:hypothetical protein